VLCVAALAAATDIGEAVRRVQPTLTDADLFDLIGSVRAPQVELAPSLKRLTETVLTGLPTR
jgi:hypothetical protein